MVNFFLAFLLIAIADGAYASIKKDSITSDIAFENSPKTKEQQLMLLAMQSGRLMRSSNPDEAIRSFQELYDLAIKHKETYYAGSALYSIGHIYMDKHNWFSALGYLELSYKTFTKDKYPARNGYVLISIGNCYFKLGSFRSAEANYRNAYEVFKPEKLNFGAAVALNNLGLIKQNIREFDSALYYFTNALSFRKRIKDSTSIGHSYYYIGDTYGKLHKFGPAIYYLNFAIKLMSGYKGDIYLQHDYLKTTADAHMSLGEIYNTLKDAVGSGINFNRALFLYDSLDDREAMSKIYLIMGKASFDNDDYVKARSYFHQSISEAHSTRDFNAIQKVEENLVNLFLHFNHADSAKVHLALLSQISDSIARKDSEERYMEIMTSVKVNESETEARILQSRKNEIQRIYLFTSIIILLLIAWYVITYIKNKKNRGAFTIEIEARKKAERELAALNKELEAGNAGKDRFISILAHDLRSPFNALMGFSDLLMTETERAGNDLLKRYAENIKLISHGAYQLLDNLLLWSRIQLGRISIQPANLDLLNETEIVQDMLVFDLFRKNLQIVNRINSGFSIYADSNMLQTILRNLFSNAIKYSRPGGYIEISSKLVEDYTEISIKDQGIGMSKDVADQLFNTESLVSSKGTTNETGSGLGLYLCKEMVERNGGKIWFETELNKGTTFFFTLPVQKLSNKPASG